MEFTGVEFADGAELCRSGGEGRGRLAVASCARASSAPAKMSWAGGARDVCDALWPGCDELHASELRPSYGELGSLRPGQDDRERPWRARDECGELCGWSGARPSSAPIFF
jgi:hypothetical protein